MIRIGMIGVMGHGYAFTPIINGYDAEKADAAKFWKPRLRLEGAKIVKVWDPNREKAENLAKICFIDKVCSSAEEVAEDVDAIIIPDKTPYPSDHQKRAFPLLDKGIPLFIDKPLSNDYEEARQIVTMAQENNTPIMSCSALRYARELEEASAEIETIKPIMTASVFGPGDLVYYGVHPLELCYTVMGPGVESVYNVGKEGKSIVRITYKDGRTMVLQVFKETCHVFHLNLYGKRGCKTILVEDGDYFYWNMLNHFLGMAKERKQPIPSEEILEIIKILMSAKKSLETGKEIVL